MIERELYSMEAEHGVLGAMMHKPDLCEEVGSTLSGSDFSSADNAMIYAMILGCVAKGIAPDPITLADMRQDLPCGDMTIVYASEIMRNVPSAANAMEYARIVQERAAARQMQSLAMQISEIAQSRGNISDQIAQAQALIMGIGTGDSRPDVMTLADALGPIYDQMQDRLDGKAEPGLKFGLEDLDSIVRGLRPGNLAIIAGRPGTGKTVLGVGLADHIAVKNGGSSLIFSLEMSAVELAKRSLSAISGVSQDWIETGKAVTDEMAVLQITSASSKMIAADMRICEKPALMFSKLLSIARFQHRAKPLDIIIIDYIGLICGDPSKTIQNRNQELGAISRGLKALAKELNIPVVALAQLNRSIETRTDSKPKMSDLRDSGEIEQDADVIIMAHRDANSERGQNGITEIDVVKCRHAKPGFCLLQFQGDKARFVSCAQARDDEEEEKPKSAKGMLRRGRNASF